jgi:hypothetical protein
MIPLPNPSAKSSILAGSVRFAGQDDTDREIGFKNEQGRSAFKGNFESVCYHPRFRFNLDKSCSAAKLGQRNLRGGR